MLLQERLNSRGYQVNVQEDSAPSAPPSLFHRILALEARRLGPCLASRARLPETQRSLDADLVIDLTGSAQTEPHKTLRLTIAGQASVSASFAEMLASGTLPELVVSQNGVAVASGRPMISNALWLSRAADELLAGAVAVLEQAVQRYFAGKLHPMEIAAPPPKRHGFLRHYLTHLPGAVLRQMGRKLASRRPFYWQVGYRKAADFTPGRPDLGAERFAALPDDGERFYADPFLFVHKGQTFLFVEEFPYDLGRGMVSVSALGADGHFGPPRIALEEPYHLSYPQVFSHAGDIFMLPESGGARRLVLYRAEAFPERWVVDTVLLDGIDINDATLIVRDGQFHLLATERVGPGSASDTMVVYSAPALRGPYKPHRLNPITIDRSGARPGGSVIEQDGRLWLKVQDGTERYGGGLGIREILQLDAEDVRLGPVLPISSAPGAFAAIHTLNEIDGWQVVDSAG